MRRASRLLAAALLAHARASEAAEVAAKLAYRGPLDESVTTHRCNMSRGEVFSSDRCVRAELAGTPSELYLLPPTWKFGVATASYQVEGGARDGGRGPSIWDTFSHTPGRTAKGATGDVAVDHYHRWREDSSLIAALGVHYYRLSIAWPRVMPDGYTLNPEGLRFYHALLDKLLAAGIEPMLTLYHWDLPQALEDAGGWRNKSMIVPAFTAYARAMFGEFGRKSKDWVTFNEPASFVFMGLGTGQHAPGRCSDRARCPAGNSSTEPFLAAHNVLLAHARTYELLRGLRGPGGSCEGCRLAMANCLQWSQPMDLGSDADWRAAERRMEAEIGIWYDPLILGHWPAVVQRAVGDRLPPFSEEEAALLKGSVDYVGLNYYTSHFVRARMEYANDADTGQYTEPDQPGRDEVVQRDHDGTPVGAVGGGAGWVMATPGGLRSVLVWLSMRYGPELEVYILESGCPAPAESDPSSPERAQLDDQWRIAYLFEYLRAAAQARLYDGVNVQGYFVWSLLDNYEWAEGYDSRFGIVRVDYERDLRRIPKASFHWYQAVIQSVRARLGARAAERRAAGDEPGAAPRLLAPGAAPPASGPAGGGSTARHALRWAATAAAAAACFALGAAYGRGARAGATRAPEGRFAGDGELAQRLVARQPAAWATSEL